MAETGIRPFGLALGGALAWGLLSQPANAESLQEALASAYATNPGIAAMRAQLRGVDETVRQARAGWFPSVTMSGNTGRGRYVSNTGPDYETSRTPHNISGTVSQPLYNGGQTEAGIDQAEFNVQATRAQLINTEQTVLLNVATAFLDIVRDKAVVALAANHVRVLQLQVDSVRVRYQAREVTQTDVGQAEARLDQAEADRINAEGNLQNSISAFEDYVGRAPNDPTAPVLTLDLPSHMEEVKTLTLRNNPAIVAADFNVRAARAGIDLAFGQNLPTVSLNGTLSRALSESSPGSRSDTKQVMLTVSVPIYDGGVVNSRVRGQKQLLAQRQNEAEQARRDAVQNAAKAWQGLRAARARVQSFTSQIRSAEIALKGVGEEQRIGSRTVIDVLNAEQELFSARQNLVAARHDEQLTAFQLAASLGRMTAKALDLPVELYDPDRHYNKVRSQMLGIGDGED